MIRAYLIIAALGCGCMAGSARGAEDTYPSAELETPLFPAGTEEIIVRGRPWGELRLRIRVAEEALFARFNEINSDDRFDIHCRTEPLIGSRIDRRICQSNSWREQDREYAQAFVREIRGETGPNPNQYRAQQLLMQRRLQAEMQRLVLADDELRSAMLDLANAQRAYAERAGYSWTSVREAVAGEGGLPFAARAMLEVRMGRDGWIYPLRGHTFTIGEVAGKIRKLALECEHGGTQLEYEAAVEWTVPAAWGTCLLEVSANPETTLTFYEFD